MFFGVGISPGDVDEDGWVDISDLALVASNMGHNAVQSSITEASVSPSGYSAAYYAEMDGDGVINVVDLVLVTVSFGASY